MDKEVSPEAWEDYGDRRALGAGVVTGAAQTASHHPVRCSVLVGIAQVALAIVWLHEAPQLPIQRDVGHVVRGEHQQVQGILAPADLLLKDRGQWVQPSCPSLPWASDMILPASGARGLRHPAPHPAPLGASPQRHTGDLSDWGHLAPRGKCPSLCPIGRSPPGTTSLPETQYSVWVFPHQPHLLFSPRAVREGADHSASK